MQSQMERIASAFVTLALVVGAIGVASATGTAYSATEAVQDDVDVQLRGVPATVISEETTTELESSQNGSDDEQPNGSEMTPGARFSGVVGAHGAKVEGEVETRTFGIKVAKAQSDQAKAKILSEHFAEIEQRLERLEERRATMKQALDNGSASKGKYTAQIAELAVETETAERLAQQGQETSDQLPETVLEDNGVDASSIKTLRDRAAGMKGGEVAQIAHQITVSHGDDAEDEQDHGKNKGDGGSDNGQNGADNDDGDDGNGQGQAGSGDGSDNDDGDDGNGQDQAGDDDDGSDNEQDGADNDDGDDGNGQGQAGSGDGNNGQAGDGDNGSDNGQNGADNDDGDDGNGQGQAGSGDGGNGNSDNGNGQGQAGSGDGGNGNSDNGNGQGQNGNNGNGNGGQNPKK